MSNTRRAQRGCVYFNYGAAYALRLLVSIYSLRNHYDGPVTVFVARDAYSDKLAPAIESLRADIISVDDLTKSFDRHRLFLASPYETTLALDSDLIFLAPIDELWEPLERDGVLVTRFHAPAYGIEGTPSRPGWGHRAKFLENVRGLLSDEAYRDAVTRQLHDGIDVNVGLMGIARPRGDAFLADWAEHMERGRSQGILMLDEMLAFALIGQHPHYLADEKWNCPADEFFRRTNLADAHVIHYFADGRRALGIRLGRSPDTWAGKKWYELYREAAGELDLRYWRSTDPTFAGPIERILMNGAVFAVCRRLRRFEQLARSRCRRLLHASVSGIRKAVG